MTNDDIQMTESGDIAMTYGDIFTTTSIKQAIIIHLRWILGEWKKFGPQYGVDYWGQILAIKKPNENLICTIIRDEINKVDGVIKTKDVKLVVDRKTREGRFEFTVVVSRERYDQELEYWRRVSIGSDIIYVEEDGELVAKTADNIKRGVFVIEDGDLYLHENKALKMVVEFALRGDLLEMKLD